MIVYFRNLRQEARANRQGRGASTRGSELVAQAGEAVAEGEVVAPQGLLRSEGGRVAPVALAQIGGDGAVDRDAAEIVQQHPAMRGCIGADAIKSKQVIVVQLLGRALAR